MIAEPNVSALYVEAFLECLRRRGMSSEQLVPADGISLPLGRISAHAFSALIKHGVREIGDPTIGLCFGHEIGGRGFGLLGIATASASTLAEAVRCLASMESLTSTLGQCAPQRDGDLLHLRWRPHLELLPAALIEGILAGWASFGRYLLGDAVPVLKASFRHAAATSRAKYEDVFQSDVIFGAEHDALTVPAELLDASVRFGEPSLHESLMAWSVDCKIVARAPTGGLVRRIVAAVEHQMPWRVANESDVSKTLGLSRRSLQRALQAQGLSYRRMLDCVRGKLAFGALMQGSNSLVDVSARAGYIEQSSFCRSFRRWSGLTPGDFVRKFPPDLFAHRT